MDLQPERYGRTMETPFQPQRQIRLLKALHTGCYNDLADTIYKMAEEDRIRSKEEREKRAAMSNDERHKVPCETDDIEKAMEAIWRDGNGTSGGRAPRVINKLLYTMHEKVIEALIDGTLASREEQGEFKELVSDERNCMGVYLVTFLIDGKYWFSTNELQELEYTMTRYLNGAGRKVSEAEVQEALDIELAWSVEGSSRRTAIHNDVENEVRTMKEEKDDKTAAFCRGLEMRKCLDLNPTGNIRPIQTQVQIGCSGDLESSMAQHNLSTGLEASGKLHNLVISCAKIMGLRITTKQIVILKLWREKDLALAEILITFLAGSMVQDGGLNVCQAGGRSTENQDPERLKATAKEVLGDNKWTMQNLERSHEEIRRRIGILKSLERHDTENRGKMEKIRERVKSLATRMEVIGTSIQNFDRDQYANRFELHEPAKSLHARLVETREVLGAAQAISEWVESTPDETTRSRFNQEEWDELRKKVEAMPKNDTPLTQDERDAIREEVKLMRELGN